ncbi:MAG: DUF6541 family protein [Bacilli bacterium]
MKKKIFYLIIIIFMSIISMLPILTNTNIMGHDTNFHIANINAIKKDLNNNILIDKLLPDIGNSFNYGTHLFYPPLPHYSTAYLAKITELFKLSTLDTLAIMYLLITIISSIIMFFLAKKITNNNPLALLSTLIFILMPYRLGDIIVRSALNEAFTFIFIPLILLSLLELINHDKKKFLILFVIGYTGLIYSHLIITLYLSLFLIPFIFIYWHKLFNKETLLLITKAIVLVTILVLPLIIPLIEVKLQGNYLVFQDNYLSGIAYVKAFSNTIKDYITILKDYSWEVPRFIPISVICITIVSILTYLKAKKSNKTINFLIIFSLLAFIISLDIFPWEYVPKFLYMIQFPWRCETMLVISLSLIAPLFITHIKKPSLKLGTTVITILIILITCLPFLTKLSTHTYLTTSSIDPNLGMGHSQEYLPVNTYNNIDYFNNRDQSIKNITDTSLITVIKNTNKELVFTINNKANEVTLELPRLYYPGYQIKSKTGILIEQKENPAGFLEITIKGNGTYYVTSPGTKLTQITRFISLTGLIYFIYLLLKKERN